MLDRPQRIKAELVGKAREADLLIPCLIVAHALPAVGGEHHLDTDVHNLLPLSHDYQEPITVVLTTNLVTVVPAKAGTRGPWGRSACPWPSLSWGRRSLQWIWARLREALSQRQLAVSLRHDRLAAFAKLGMAAAVAHDPADL